MSRAATIGFDRRLRLEWLDAIAAKRAAGLTVAELRKFGHQFLRGDLPADEARGKTLTVLFHLWVEVPRNAVALRECASELLGELGPRQRIALHWGLGLATYPFFRDTADATGRLLALQDSVSLAQIQRRLAGKWGQRSTAERAAQRIVRSWIDWGVLSETSQRGTYVPAKRVEVSGSLASWVIEALLVGGDAEAHSVVQVRKAPQLFPFAVETSAHDLRRAPRLVVHRQGVSEDVVLLRPAEEAAKRGAENRQAGLF